jgi:hypothetical protein
MLSYIRCSALCQQWEQWTSCVLLRNSSTKLLVVDNEDGGDGQVRTLC